jgi:hypothetical protein
MRYFKNLLSGEVFGYDEEEQEPFIQSCIDDPVTWEDVTGSWPPAPVPPTIEQQFEAVRFALQSAIDVEARELGFSGGNALMLYVGFENAFQPVAQVFAAWEATVWVQAGEYRAQVLAEISPMVSPEEAVAMMPELVMP